VTNSKSLKLKMDLQEKHLSLLHNCGFGS